MAIALACGGAPSILAAEETNRIQNDLAEFTRTTVLGSRVQLWSGSRRARHCRLFEPAISESRHGPEPGADRKSGVDSDGRLGGRIFFLGLGGRSISCKHAQQAS